MHICKHKNIAIFDRTKKKKKKKKIRTTAPLFQRDADENQEC